MLKVVRGEPHNDNDISNNVIITVILETFCLGPTAAGIFGPRR